MKILYITNWKEIARHSGGFINDYQNDLVFYGLKELYGNDVVDSTQIPSLYKENQSRINKAALWGGMTAFWLLDTDNTDRTAIEEKIQSHYYDIIIYGAIQRCQDYYPLVSKYYKPKEIILIDGNDDQELHPLHRNHLYFKRELLTSKTARNVRPISFAMPTKYVVSTVPLKEKDYATCIPGMSHTYIFTNEEDYYHDYQISRYGVTTKKAGWDSLRHYEILGNGCVPYFIDLEQCPSNTLINMPKELLIEARELTMNFSHRRYDEIAQELLIYTQTYLTTKALAQYIINEISDYSSL